MKKNLLFSFLGILSLCQPVVGISVDGNILGDGEHFPYTVRNPQKSVVIQFSDRWILPMESSASLASEDLLLAGKDAPKSSGLRLQGVYLKARTVNIDDYTHETEKFIDIIGQDFNLRNCRCKTKQITIKPFSEAASSLKEIIILPERLVCLSGKFSLEKGTGRLLIKGDKKYKILVIKK